MNKNIFLYLEKQLIEMGLDADLDSFETIRERLVTGTRFDADEFARQAIYVVLAGGFSQKTAKKIHAKIMGEIKKGNFDLLPLFNNKNKISAILKIWENRQRFRDSYYQLEGLPAKLAYLAGLPHIGKITANHLARNLGENVFKRDVWIERLLAKFGEDLLDRLERETDLPRGYVDVVLWKACQNGLIKF